MRILFITDNFPPEVNAPATRTYEHIQEWIKDDDTEVTVLTCTPNFPQGEVYDGYKNRFYQKESMDGIEVIRVWSYITSNRGFVKRVVDYMSFAMMAFFVGLFQKYDIVIATSPQFFTTWAGWALSKIRRKPWIFEVRDLWPESIKSVGVMKQGKVIEFLEKIELRLYKSADSVVVVTNSFKENLIARGIEAKKIEIVTNGSNVELFIPREKDRYLLEQLCLKDKFVIGYIGTHGMAHSLDFVVQSISNIEDENIHFLFIGNGAMKERVVALSQSLKLKNITFLAPISKELVPRYLSIVDISLVPLKKSDTFKKVIPSKIFESSSMKKPTLLGVQGEAERIIEKYGAGVCYEPENEEDFIQKIYLLKNDKKLYISLEEGCVALSSHYNRKKLADKMLTIIKKTLSTTCQSTKLKLPKISLPKKETFAKI